jgi:hypothetical protein
LVGWNQEFNSTIIFESFEYIDYTFRWLQYIYFSHINKHSILCYLLPFMCILWYNLQLVEGGQYLVEVEVPEFISTTWYVVIKFINNCRGRDRDSMGVGFTTTCPISAYHHKRCEFKPRSWRGALDTTLCDKVCQWLATGRWFSSSTPVSPTNETCRRDITEILLKVALNTITLNLINTYWIFHYERNV